MFFVSIRIYYGGVRIYFVAYLSVSIRIYFSFETYLSVSISHSASIRLIPWKLARRSFAVPGSALIMPVWWGIA